MFSRRSFLAGAFAVTGCGRRRGHGFDGYAFVANQEGGAVAAVDLTAFAVVRHIRVNGAPSEVIAHPRRPSVYVLTPASGAVHEIGQDTLAVRRTVRLDSRTDSMRLSPDGAHLYLLCRESRELISIGVETLKPEGHIRISGRAFDFDISPDGLYAAMSHPELRAAEVVALDSRRTKARMVLAGEPGVLRFRSDGRYVLIADRTMRVLSIFETSSGATVTHLPLAVSPEHFCFNADGGQMFITGPGMDAVVVVYPHNTPQVAETALAGRTPGFMAATRPGSASQLLFVTNPNWGHVTILDIRTRRAIATVAVGSSPEFICITPDNQYALVLNRVSGDLAVIRIPTITARRTKAAALFTMIPVGSKPVSADVAHI
ncbi:MAG: hypothetical protein HUU41_14690 [Bryobacteraceae bacterium]|nr:hypothetical protein [Bryobacterales bacterium]MEB2363370.1 hypothetical protein [Bryobacterales bacterium]NUN02358.1 hypothetical protein [Bryobacteraceae bacterium]